MEVSFEQLGQDLQAGRIVGYDTITDFGNPQFNMRREESIKPNKLMEFRYRDGSVKKAIVFQQGQDIFEPKVNFLTFYQR